MALVRFATRYRLEVFAVLIATVLIITGLLIPIYMPDEVVLAIGVQDTAWIKAIISVLFIGLGMVCFIWLIVINRVIRRTNKSDLLY